MVAASEFRDALKGYLEQVENGDEIHITKHGKVVARLLPPAPPVIDLDDMDAYYDEFDYYEEGNPVVEMREDYRA